jgi:hypothetical protein
VDLEKTYLDGICRCFHAVLKGSKQGWFLLVHLQEELTGWPITPHDLHKSFPAGQRAEHLDTRKLTWLVTLESLPHGGNQDLGQQTPAAAPHLGIRVLEACPYCPFGGPARGQ